MDCGRFEARAGSGEGDCAGSCGGADGDAVDAAFGVEIEVIDGVKNATVVTAAPDGRAGEVKIDAGLIGRAALAFSIKDLKVNKGDIGAVGLEAVWRGVESEFEARGWAGGLELVLRDDFAGGDAYGFDLPGHKMNGGEGVDIAGIAEITIAVLIGIDEVAGLVGRAHEFAVDEELHVIAMVGGDVDGFDCVGGISPMADDM